MAWFDAPQKLPRELICWAHQQGARVVFTTSIPESLLQGNTTSQTQRAWARQMVDNVNAVGGDGLNVDYENPVDKMDVRKQDAITYITNELQILLKASNPYSSLSI
ncbi:MAG: hypothetical protein SGARI_002423 [Bacillariaceae sp.]